MLVKWYDVLNRGGSSGERYLGRANGRWLERKRIGSSCHAGAREKARQEIGPGSRATTEWMRPSCQPFFQAEYAPTE